MKKIGVIASALAIVASAALPAAAMADSESAPYRLPTGICKQVQLHVALAPGQDAKQYIAGTFCYPFSGDANRSVDVLVHGATYDRTYWDSAFNYPQYSYVTRTLKAGRAVFYYDRLGVGKSSPLPSKSVDMYADAYVVHQILHRLQPVFHTTNLIGHSYGSRIAALETSEYNDATRLILTDNLHAAGPALVNNEIKQYPANQDPLFAGKGLDDGWTTTQPGARTPFYYLPGADANEIAFDDAHKAILSTTEFQQGQELGRVPAPQYFSNKITRPVYLIAGEEDRLYCGLALDCHSAANIKTNEQPYYTAAPSLDVKVIADTGHDLALHKSAQDSFDAINDWLK